MTAHTHPCCVCETVEVACDRPTYDASVPPKQRALLRLRVCERCRAHHDALNGDHLLILLRGMVQRSWWRSHDDECSRTCDFAVAPCGVEVRVDDSGLPDDCSCGRDETERDARAALKLRIAELTARAEAP